MERQRPRVAGVSSTTGHTDMYRCSAVSQPPHDAHRFRLVRHWTALPCKTPLLACSHHTPTEQSSLTFYYSLVANSIYYQYSGRPTTRPTWDGCCHVLLSGVTAASELWNCFYGISLQSVVAMNTQFSILSSFLFHFLIKFALASSAC